MKHAFFLVASFALPLSAGACLLTSDFDGLASGGGTSSSTSGAGGDEGDCCLGQLCGADGQCLPIELDTQGVPTSIALSDTTIFWTDSVRDEVRALPKVLPPGFSPEVFAAGEVNADNAFVRDEHLYWTRYDDSAGTFEVRRRPLDASADASSIAAGMGRVEALFVDATHAYFSLQFQADSTGRLDRVLRDGGAAETLVGPEPYVMGSVTADLSAPDGPALYWVRASASPEGAVASIHKDKLPAEDEALLVTGLPRPQSLVVDGALYWTHSEAVGPFGDALMTAALDGSGVTVVDATLATPWALAKHGDTLAWTAFGPDDGPGSVALRVLPSGPTRVLAASEAQPGSIATDGRAVVWGNEYDGRVRMIGTCACTP